MTEFKKGDLVTASEYRTAIDLDFGLGIVVGSTRVATATALWRWEVYVIRWHTTYYYTQKELRKLSK